MVAVFCLSQARRGGDKSKKEQEKVLSKLFHREEKTQAISHATMLADGLERVFRDTFKDIPRKPGQKHIKALSNPSDMAAVLGTNLTLQVLERAVFTRPDLITGCQLHSLATKVSRNITKAICAAEKHLDSNTGKARRSGEEISSVANHVLDALFLLLHGCDKDAGSNSSNEDDNNPAGDANAHAASPGSNLGSHPSDWFFPGFTSLSCTLVPLRETLQATDSLTLS